MASTKGKSAIPAMKALLNRGINAMDTLKPGHVHAKLPFKYQCVAGRVYMWCSCGWSRTQPFCDGTHKNAKLMISNRPLRFECQESGEYWFCQCKQTKTRPFCDGSHNSELVKNANATFEQNI